MASFWTPAVLLLVSLSSCKATDQKYILQSETLPDNVKLLPAVGNGHVATEVTHDTIYMNAVFSGRGADSHRARIRSTVAINITASDVTNNMYTLDMKRGVFLRTFGVQKADIEQRVYAHRTRTRLLINEIIVTRKTGQTGDVVLPLATNQGEESMDLKNVNEVAYGSYTYRNATINTTETETSTEVQVHQYFTPVPANVTLPDGTATQTFRFMTSLSITKDDAKTAFDQNVDATDLFETHVQDWASVWDSGHIDITDDLDLARTINACFFHIFISTPSETDPVNPFMGHSPGGLARGGKTRLDKVSGPYNDYAGHVFWDMDTWVMPPIMLFHPNLGKVMIKSRIRVMDAVRDHARNTGFRGVRFPWEQGYTGYEVCPWDLASLYQVHVTADVSYAIRQYLYATKDTAFMKNEKGTELAMEIARFWESRGLEKNNQYEIHGVMGPDENHANVNNSVFTNYNAKLSMELPTYIKDHIPDSGLTAGDATEIAGFKQKSDRMYLPFDPVNKFHPQYDGFDVENSTIKQSDVVLLGYPLMKPMTSEVRRNDLMLYEELTDKFGPDTGTWSMHTVGWLELGNTTKAADMFRLMFRNVNGPFKIFSEKPAWGEQGMRATNFITGMGGLLQSILFGYGGLRLRMHQLDLLPILIPNSTAWEMLDLTYRKSNFNVQVTSTQFTIKLVRKEAGAENLYLINQADRRREVLQVDRSVTKTTMLYTMATESDLNKVEYFLPLPSSAHITVTSLGTLLLAAVVCMMFN